MGALTIILGVGLMATAGYLISRAAEQPSVLALTGAIVGVRFFGLSRPVARYFDRLTSHDTALRALQRTRLLVYERVEPLTPVQVEGNRRGDLLSRLVADVDSLQELQVRGVTPPLVALVAGAVAVGATAAFLPAAAFVLAGGLLLAATVCPAATAALGARASAGSAAARGNLSAELVEAISGSAELVAFGREGERLDLLREADRRLVSGGRRATAAAGLGDGLLLAVLGATVAGVLAVSVAAHAGGTLARVEIAMLALLALASFEAVKPLPQAARELAGTLAAGRRILDLTDREPAVADPPDPLPIPAEPITIELVNVRVRYGLDEPLALDGFDLRLEPGRRIALVGPSGAGKTTVANVLLRFIDPESGRVLLNGEDLCRYRQEDVRRVVAVAGQDAHLFSASIRDNVTLGREATDELLERALRAARIWDWAQTLPDGLDALVGEEGRALSGGQRQRLVLARALLVDAPVLVLDEPTAHLDPPTAERLLEDVFAGAGERCVLLITHRPEGLELVDEVRFL
jgi:thiol reductant ABC exporter CydC subunit